MKLRTITAWESFDSAAVQAYFATDLDPILEAAEAMADAMELAINCDCGRCVAVRKFRAAVAAAEEREG